MRVNPEPGTPLHDNLQETAKHVEAEGFMLEVLASMLSTATHTADATHLDSCPICARRAAEECALDDGHEPAVTRRTALHGLRGALHKLRTPSRLTTGVACAVAVAAVVIGIVVGTDDRTASSQLSGMSAAAGGVTINRGAVPPPGQLACVLVMPSVPAWSLRSAQRAGYADSFQPLLPGSAAGLACRGTTGPA